MSQYSSDSPYLDQNNGGKGSWHEIGYQPPVFGQATPPLNGWSSIPTYGPVKDMLPKPDNPDDPKYNPSANQDAKRYCCHKD